LEKESIKTLLSDGSLPLLILKSDSENPVVVLENGNDFQYQLNNNIPLLKMGKGYYILPGLDDQYFCIIFPRSIPDIFLNAFEKKISLYCSFKVAEKQLSEESILSLIENSNNNNNQVNKIDIMYKIM